MPLSKTTHELIIESALRTIQLQAASVAGLSVFVNGELIKTVETISSCKGRLVVSGIGKSAIVAQKIVATLNSTGTPALFMHAADAIHGDLGMIQKDDIVMIISKSGDSPEIKVLAPLVKNFGNILIGMVGNLSSYLAQQSNIVINTTVDQEACPNNLAPTTSTTAQMVMGDVLAICLMETKEFNTSDFAKFHPGGSLGKKIYLRAGDLIVNNEKPQVSAKDSIKTTILEISKKRLGATAVFNQTKLVGIITDGDVRRMFEKFENFKEIVAEQIMSSSPLIIQSNILAIQALEIMKQHNINQLIVMNKAEFAGILHIHDLIREGII